MKLLASGRDADIFEHGPGLVLRRARTGRSMATEARTMAWARDHGYPVPAVDSISDDGLDLVMERIDGVSMVEALGRRPWTIRDLGRTLADLHRRLHEIPAPDWVPPAPCGATGDRLLHLDLHPLNVMITGAGPVVIDWPNAHAGDPATDVAITWALMSAGAVEGGAVVRLLARRGRRSLIGAFLADVDADAARRALPSVVDWKVGDPNLSPAECAVLRSMV